MTPVKVELCHHVWQIASLLPAVAGSLGERRSLPCLSPLSPPRNYRFSSCTCTDRAGLGKTSLLSQFARLAEQGQVSAYALDARNIEPTPEAFTAGLCLAMGIDPTSSPTDALAARPGRHVILVDTYELLAPLDGWLRDVFLPQLPERVLVVLASRNPPAPAWRADPGWQPFLRSLPLRNLSPDEGRDYLMQRNVPEEELKTVLDFTHSYPLALSLVADLYDQRPGFHFKAIRGARRHQDPVGAVPAAGAGPGTPGSVGILRAGASYHRVPAGPIGGSARC